MKQDVNTILNTFKFYQYSLWQNLKAVVSLSVARVTLNTLSGKNQTIVKKIGVSELLKMHRISNPRTKCHKHSRENLLKKVKNLTKFFTKEVSIFIPDRKLTMHFNSKSK